MTTPSNPDRSSSLSTALTLRRRMDIVVGAVFLLTIFALTVSSALFARSEVLRTERLHGQALLDHFRSNTLLRDSPAVNREIAHLQPYLLRVGAGLTLREPVDASSDGLVIASVLSEAEGKPTLYYVVGAPRIAQVTRKIVVMHGIAALVALALALAAVEWTLRRRLALPLVAMRHQIETLSRYGWFVAVPDVDDELAQLQKVLGEVGPAVSARTIEWMRRENANEKAVAERRIRDLMDVRIPAAVERIETLTRSGRLSVLSLNEAYGAEEEILAIAGALVELPSMLESPRRHTEGHA